MTITNLSATLSGSFGIGKKGVTLFQGTSVPSSGTGKAGDIYFYISGTSSIPYVKQGTSWVPLASTGLSPIANNRILSNISGSSAIPVANTISATLDATLGSAQGSILYRGASSWNVLPNGSVGQYLETRGAAQDPRWSSTPIAHPGIALNRYYSAYIDKGSISTSNHLGSNFLIAVPIFIPGNSGTINRVGIDLVSGNQAGAKIRLGIYDNGVGVPNNLLIDAGEVDASTIANKEVTISLPNSEARWLWLVYVCNNSSLQIRSYQQADSDRILGRTAPSGNPSNYVYRAFTYGVLPSTFGTALYNSSSQLSPELWIRKV